MIKELKKNISSIWSYLGVIGIFLILIGTHLFLFDKVAGHIHINQFYNDFGDSIFPYLTYIGDGIASAIFILILMLYRVKYGLAVLISFLFTAAITHYLKYFVYEDVQRPFLFMWDYFHSKTSHLVLDEDLMRVKYSFPSGHTTSIMSICISIAIIAKKKKFVFLLATLACFSGFSRVYLSQHFMEDIFTGALIGTIGSLIMMSWLLPVFEKKFGNKGVSAKRIFDMISTFIVMILGLPFFILVSILIAFTSKGGVFFVQKRVGKNNKDFGLYKFRTMHPNSEKQGQITVGGKDPRITKVGYFLRKFKLDEFPQLLNILKGDMSIVGPRPEVRKYVDLYNKEQLKVLAVKPGLTDFASIEYFKENELLGNSSNPDKTYIEEIMPAKLNLNLKYIEEQSFGLDMKLIFRTFGKILK